MQGEVRLRKSEMKVKYSGKERVLWSRITKNPDVSTVKYGPTNTLLTKIRL